MNLSPTKIAQTNVLRKRFRSASLATLTAVISFVLAAGLILSAGLDRGFSQLSQRLGADAIVLPGGAKIDEQSVLLQGDMNYKYFSRDVVDFVRNLKGVVVATPQFYFASLGSACCDQKVNIIGFDPKSDFVIQPWIRKVYSKKIEKGSLIVGSDVHLKNSETIKLFNTEYKVVAQLEPMGNKLDQAVFTDFETVELIRENAQKAGFNFLFKSETNVSAVLLKLSKNADLAYIGRELHTRFDGLQFKAQKDLFSGFRNTTKLFRTVVIALIAFFVLVGVVANIIVFSISANERKKEYAILRVVGATQRTLKKIVLFEVAGISVVGATFGTVFGILAAFLFRVAASDALEMPFLLPSVSVSLLIAVASFAFPVLTALLSTYRISNKVAKADVYAALRDE